MGYVTEPHEMPCGIEAAVWRLDSAARRDRSPVQVMACGDGHPSVTFYNADGTVTSTVFIDGAWHEQGMVV